MFIVTSCTIAKKICKQLKFPSIDEWIKNMSHTHTHTHTQVISHKKYLMTCNSMVDLECIML